MAKPFSVSIDTSNFRARYRQYCDNLKKTLQQEWPVITLQVLHDIRSRTPDKDTEYNLLMTGANAASALVQRDGDRSGDNDQPSTHVKDRIRFLRYPGEWLENLIYQDAVSTPGTLEISLGHVPYLERFSRFGWQNHSVKLGTMPHQSAYGVWSFFEYGLSHTVQPTQGNTYKLTPTEQTRVWFMEKSYPAFRFYSGFHKSVFYDAVMDVVRQVPY